MSDLMQPFRNVLALARLFVIDGIRRKALLGFWLLAMFAIVCGLFFFEFIPRDIGRAATTFVLSIDWAAGLIFLLFHAVQVISWDEERRVIHMLLARPLSRSQYILGVFTGLFILLLMLHAVLGALGYGTLTLIDQSVNEYYFPVLSRWGFVVGLLSTLILQAMVLAIIVLFSGMVRGSMTVLLVTIAYLLICNGLPVVRELVLARIEEGLMSGWIAHLLKGLTVFFPDFQHWTRWGDVVTKELGVSTGTLLMQGGAAVAYVSVILIAACLIYRRKDLK